MCGQATQPWRMFHHNVSTVKQLIIALLLTIFKFLHGTTFLVISNMTH